MVPASARLHVVEAVEPIRMEQPAGELRRMFDPLFPPAVRNEKRINLLTSFRRSTAQCYEH